MRMYTGHQIRHNRIYKAKTKTLFDLNGNHIYCASGQPTGYYLEDGLSLDVKHIYGPDGYSKFYVQDGHIYGPNTCLPWENGYGRDLTNSEQLKRA